MLAKDFPVHFWMLLYCRVPVYQRYDLVAMESKMCGCPWWVQNEILPSFVLKNYTEKSLW